MIETSWLFICLSLSYVLEVYVQSTQGQRTWFKWREKCSESGVSGIKLSIFIKFKPSASPWSSVWEFNRTFPSFPVLTLIQHLLMNIKCVFVWCKRCSVMLKPEMFFSVLEAHTGLSEVLFYVQALIPETKHFQIQNTTPFHRLHASAFIPDLYGTY